MAVGIVGEQLDRLTQVFHRFLHLIVHEFELSLRKQTVGLVIALIVGNELQSFFQFQLT